MSLARNVCRLMVACLLLGQLQAHASVCDDPGDPAYIAGRFVEHGSSGIEGGSDHDSGEMRQQNRSLDLLLATRAKGLLFGFRHRYTKFNFAGIEPQTNAHLHVMSFPLHWFAGSKNLRLALAPGLAASSNLLGKPEHHRGGTARLEFALVQKKRVAERLEGWYGICRDDRFGTWRFYPTLGVSWQPRPEWTVELGFPSSEIRYELSKRITTTLAVSLEGNEWHVMDRDFSENSSFRYEAYALELIVDLQPHRRFSIAASLGRQLRNRLEMTLQTGDRVAVATEPANRIAAEIRWHF